MGEKATNEELHGTDGGSPKDFFTPHEERMLGMIGKSSVLGIEGGIDKSIRKS